jgi:hypothetical protein
MSIAPIRPEYPDRETVMEEMFGDLLGTECFFCYRPLTRPFVLWSGASGYLSLHPACVLNLFLRLARDVWELQCKDDLTCVLASDRVDKTV